MSYSAIFLQICKKFNIFCISTKYVEFCTFKVKKKKAESFCMTLYLQRLQALEVLNIWEQGRDP